VFWFSASHFNLNFARKRKANKNNFTSKKFETGTLLNKILLN